MVATAYAKSVSGEPARLQPLEGGLASPGEPLRGRPDSFELEAVLEAGRIQASWLNNISRRQVAGGRLLCLSLSRLRANLTDLGAI